jgi:hypothetical protein
MALARRKSSSALSRKDHSPQAQMEQSALGIMLLNLDGQGGSRLHKVIPDYGSDTSSATVRWLVTY